MARRRSGVNFSVRFLTGRKGAARGNFLKFFVRIFTTCWRGVVLHELPWHDRAPWLLSPQAPMPLGAVFLYGRAAGPPGGKACRRRSTKRRRCQGVLRGEG